MRVFLIIVSFVISLIGATLIVDDDATCSGGSCSSGCENGDRTFRYIRDALAEAEDGDTIKICKGDYEESDLRIDKDVRITSGSDADTVSDVIVHDDAKDPIFRLIDKRSGVTIENITIRQEKSKENAIEINDDDATDLLLQNLVITSEGGGIVATEKLRNARLISLSITAAKRGISFDQIENGVTLSDVKIESGDEGIVFADKVKGGGSFENLQIRSDDSGVLFKKDITGGLTIKKSRIESGAYAIRLQGKAKDGTLLEDLVLESQKSGILFEEDVSDGIAVKDIEIDAQERGIDFEGKVKGGSSFEKLRIVSQKSGVVFAQDVSDGITIKESAIVSGNRGIDFDGKVKDGALLEDIVIQSDSVGLLFQEKVQDGIAIKKSRVVSKDRGIDFEDEVANGTLLEDLEVVSDSIGVLFQKKVKDGLTLHQCDIDSGEEGLLFKGRIDGGAQLEDLEIYSDRTGVKFEEKLGDGITIKTSTIVSLSGRGIDFQNRIDEDCTLQQLRINAKEEGIYFTDEKMQPKLSEVVILSLEKDALYIKADDSTQFELKDSCLQTAANSEYGLNLDIENDEGKVNNNCFYAPDEHHLARAREQGNDFDGNYWDGHSGDYTFNNIEDHNPLSSCPHTCDFVVIPKPLIEYRMDECAWDEDETSYEVRNTGLYGESKNATSLNGAQTVDSADVGGVLCRVGDVVDGDRALLIKDNFSLPSSYTLMLWVKFPLSDANHKDFKGKLYFNIADRVGRKNDFLYFRYDSDDGWALCVHGEDWECKDFDPQSLSGWHHLAFAIDGGGTRFYLDGEERLHFDEHPDSGEIGLVTNSDYDRRANGDNVPNGQSIGALIDEFKIFSKRLRQVQIRKIYENERDGRSYDGSGRSCGSCADGTQVQGTFNAITDPAGACDASSDWENNLTTQIAGRPFALYILAKDAQNGDPIEANITKVIFYLHQSGDERSCSGEAYRSIEVCSQCGETNSSGCLKLSDITIDRAARCVRVWIEGKEVHATETNESNATDNFALRPARFDFESNESTLYAGETFGLNFRAYDDKNVSTLDYNESKGTSFGIEVNLTRSGCKLGRFDLADFTFADGAKDAVAATYSEVAEVNITIREIDTKEFAVVDRDDTQERARKITPFSRVLRFAPYEINVTDVRFGTSTNTGWLYMAQDVADMNVTLAVDIVAYNAFGDRVADYNTSCFGYEELNLSFAFDINNTSIKSNSEVNVTYADINNSAVAARSTLADLNVSYAVSTSDFVDGATSSSWAFGIDKNISQPLSPIGVKLLDIALNGSSAKYLHGAKASGQIQEDMNATFYYARFLTQDLLTDSATSSTKASILVFSRDSNSYVKDLNETLVDWYLMSLHTKERYGTIKQSAARAGVRLSDSAIDLSVETNLSQGGIYRIDVTNNDTNTIANGYIHLDIDRWLWYVPAGFGQAYSFASDSSCLEHPCIHYSYLQESGEKVKSGDTNGTNLGDLNVTTQERGVRIFR